MNKNILLYSGQTSKTPFLPIGLLLIASSLRKDGYNPIIIQNIKSIKEFDKLLTIYNPFFVGFSVFTSNHIKETINFSRKAKERGLIVVWGGHHPTVLSNECINEEYIDFVVKGEGETAIIDLCNHIAKYNKKQTKIIFENKNNVDINKYEPALDLVDLGIYVTKPQESIRSIYPNLLSFGYLLTSRGCVYNCSFCSVKNILLKNNAYKSISSNNIIKQIDYIISVLPHINSFILWDDCFFKKSVPTDREIEILSHLKKRKIKFNLEARANFLINSQNIEFLVSMGCTQVYVGAESASQRVLDLMNKKTTIELYDKAIENCIKQNLPIRLSFFYGFPGEKFNDIIMTKKYISKISKISSLVSISGPKLYRPTPGTKAFRSAIDLGFIPPKTTEEWSAISSSNIDQLPWLINECNNNGITYKDIISFLDIRI